MNKHCCGVTLQAEGIGYSDLNDLIKDPQDLEFTIELCDIVQPNEYEKEPWQMTTDEKLKNIPMLREKGNQLFGEKKYDSAASCYATAIGTIDQLMLTEKPKSPEWLDLEKMKIPLLLNYAQCKLLMKEYYAVIEHCTTVLEIDPDNVKALYRRGKAHIGAWNELEAVSDLQRAAHLNVMLYPAVQKELRTFSAAVKEKELVQRKSFSQVFSS